MSIYFACTQVHQETNTTFTAQYPGSIQAIRSLAWYPDFVEPNKPDERFLDGSGNPLYQEEYHIKSNKLEEVTSHPRNSWSRTEPWDSSDRSFPKQDEGQAWGRCRRRIDRWIPV